MFAKDLPNLSRQSDDQDTPTSRQIILIEGEYIYYSQNCGIAIDFPI